MLAKKHKNDNIVISVYEYPHDMLVYPEASNIGFRFTGDTSLELSQLKKKQYSRANNKSNDSSLRATIALRLVNPRT